MKKIFFCWLCLSLFCLGNLFAQDNFKVSVYFKSGQSKLDATAIAELEKLLKESQEHYDFDLDVKAYSDDLGKSEKNIILAQKRAEAVVNFLGKKGLKASSQKLDNMGEIALKGKQNKEEQRRKNRRVDITLSPFSPKDLNDLYTYFGNRYKQKFYIKNNRDTTIIGEKGSILFIPRGSLAFKNDTTKLKDQVIEIEFREAYTYQDMFLQNLTTSANGKMLQTGGMVHIGAKTLDGRELEIKENASLNLTMPSDKKLPKDMRLFTADRDINNPNETINWTTDTDPKNVFREPSLFDREDIRLFPLHFEHHDVPNPLTFPMEIDDKYFDKPETPKKIPVPKKPRRPVFNSEKPKKKPTIWEDIVAKNPRTKKESKRKYKDRIARIQRKNTMTNKRDSTKYSTNLAYYQKRLIQHSEDSIAYEQALSDRIQDSIQLQRDYETRLATYITKAQTCRNWIKANKAYLQNWGETISPHFRFAANDAQSLLLFSFKGIQAAVKGYRNFMIQEAQLLGTSEMQTDIIATYDDLTKLKKVYTGLSKLIGGTKYYYKNEFMSSSADFDASMNEIKNGNKRDKLRQLSQTLDKAEKDSTYFTRYFKYSEDFLNLDSVSDDRILWICEHYWRANNSLEEHFSLIGSLYNDIVQDPLARGGVDSIFNEVQYYQQTLTKLKCERDWLGSLTTEEQKTYKTLSLEEKNEFWDQRKKRLKRRVENRIGISRLGWINCDAFVFSTNIMPLEVTTPKINFLMTEFYVCFKNYEAMLPAVTDADKQTVRTINVPKNEDVIIIGISVDAGKVSVSKTEGKVGELNNRPIKKFKPCKLQELKSLF